MQLVLVNRQTKVKKIIDDCESIALIDADQQTHLPPTLYAKCTVTTWCRCVCAHPNTAGTVHL